MYKIESQTNLKFYYEVINEIDESTIKQAIAYMMKQFFLLRSL